MKKYLSKRSVFAFILGLLVAIFIGLITIPNIAAKENVSSNNSHSHSDFLMVIEGIKIDFTNDRYQSKEGALLEPDIHLHDNKGNIIHRHATDVTIGSFFESLGFKYTADCLTTDLGTSYCATGDKKVQLYVNDKLEPAGPNYVPQNLDKILIVFGLPQTAEKFFTKISDEACIYSGSCKEVDN